MLTIVLSGPKSAATQARTALASRGFGVTDNRHDYGLADPQGQPQEFVHVQGDDVDAAHAAVAPLGYRLTLHYATPEASPPSLEQQLADVLAQYDRRIAAVERQSQRPPIRGGAVESPGFANQNATYGAEQTRRAIASMLLRGGSIGSVLGGLVGATDCQLTPPGSGMTVSVAPGEVWVPGSSSATQSGYYCRASSSTSLAIAASDPSNPRIDRVSALITDKAYSGSTDTFALAVETGTPTAGATLNNLNGAAAAPASSLTLGYVLVPATATNIVSGDIENIATRVTSGLSPLLPLTTGSVTAQPGQWINATFGSTVTLPTPIPGALIAIGATGIYSGTPVTVTGTSIRGVNFSGSSFLIGTPNAVVILAGTTDGAWEIISGQQDTGWKNLTLGSNVTVASGGYYTPAARLIGDRVWLRGSMECTASLANSSTWATLPTIMFPTTQVRQNSIVNCFNVAAGGFLPGLAVITTAGAYVPSNHTGATFDTGSIVDLDGTSYSLV